MSALSPKAVLRTLLSFSLESLLFLQQTRDPIAHTRIVIVAVYALLLVNICSIPALTPKALFLCQVTDDPSRPHKHDLVFFAFALLLLEGMCWVSAPNPSVSVFSSSAVDIIGTFVWLSMSVCL